MPHLHRFYAAPETLSAGESQLSSEESHHALHVLRVRTGDAVAVFDGQGRELRGQVAGLTRRDVSVALAEERSAQAPAPPVTLAQAWLHRDKAIETVIRRGTELGVNRFLFFRAERSEKAPRLHAKWQRIAVEACKQCGRLWLPEVALAGGLAEAMAESEGDVLISTMHTPPVPLGQALSGGAVMVLVGPEGDFSKEEVDLALRMDARPISLGDTIFRSEVAAALAVALVRYHLGGLGPRG